MPRKTFTPEQIVAKLRQIEVLVSQGRTVPQACKEVGIVEQTFYRWRKEYGDLKVEQASRAAHSQSGQIPGRTARRVPVGMVSRTTPHECMVF